MHFSTLTVITAFSLVDLTLANPLHKNELTSRALADRDAGGGSATKNKRGLAWELNDYTLLPLFTKDQVPNTKADWTYNWQSKTPRSIQEDVPKEFEYVPMLKDIKGQPFENWDINVKAALDHTSKHILGFNEPDQEGQSLMPVEDCIKGWKKHIDKYSDRATLVSPAVTSTDKNPNKGLPYLKKFLAGCTGCHVSKLAIHWYGSHTQLPEFKTHVSNAYETGEKKLPLWITEFAATDGTPDQQETFMRGAMEHLDSLSYVERYAYFFVKEGRLVSGKTKSKLGTAFASA